MPDQNQPVSLIQNSLSAGEIAPGLYGRQDLAKVHQGAALMKNFFVDYKGGASSRPGTQYLGQPSTSGRARLIPFKFSAAIGQTYMLVFSDSRLRFIKNPGGATYPNSSNAGLILSGGVPYEIAIPYVEADLPYLKSSQIADQMVITRHGYARRVLSRISDTNWTLTAITNDVGLTPPVIANIVGTAVIAPDPGNTRYMFVVTAVDYNGNESLPSTPFVSGAALNLALSQGTVTVFWGAVAGAQYYRVYKALPTPGGVVPNASEQFGFAGVSYGTQFVDNNIVPDFTLSPPAWDDPFANSKITGYSISASSADWPVGGTSITVTDGTGTGAVIYPILDNNTAGGVGHIVGLYIANGGQNYTAPTLTATGGGTTFTATASLSASSGNDPDVVGLFQQRRVYASTINNPNSVWGSRPSLLNDFRKHNPVIDSDAYQFALASEQVDDITWLQSMPGGLVIATNSGIVQLTGGSLNAANPSAVTPSNATMVPQSFYGASDVAPIVIDYDILYVQSEGSVIRDLQYNFFVNIYTGTDVTILSSHLFYPLTVTSWAYQDTPYKVIWAVQDSGRLLSLTWLKGQEIAGWAQHETNGTVEDVAVVREGSEDALYLLINRGGLRFIERLCDRIYNQIDDCWCLDAALSTIAHYPAANIVLSGITGSDVQVLASAAVFAPGDVGKVIRAIGGKGIITNYVSNTQVVITIQYTFGSNFISVNNWRMDPVVSTITGLTHLNTSTVYALVDGVVQGPFVVSGGQITLMTPGSQVVVGLLYICQTQPLYIDVGGEQTIQGRLKKVTAATLRVKDAARVKFGSNFSNLQEWKPELNTDPVENWPNTGTGMYIGDIRAYISPIFDRVGAVCVQQDLPLPVTITAMIPEVVQGDTK